LCGSACARCGFSLSAAQGARVADTKAPAGSPLLWWTNLAFALSLCAHTAVATGPRRSAATPARSTVERCTTISK
jgi:hypothetical protein